MELSVFDEKDKENEGTGHFDSWDIFSRNEERVRLLIHLYENKECLWNTVTDEHHLRGEIRAAKKSMAESLKMSGTLN